MTHKKIYNAYLRYKEYPLYVLGASAYTSYDLKLCGFNERKCFKWGYFPETRARDITSLLEQKRNNKVVEILYAGRLLFLKRVLDTVKALHALLKQGIVNFRFTIIGDGEQKRDIEKYVQKHSLQKHVRMFPFMPAEKVREYMDASDIYVFSSNIYEGWGAVVNEAMDSACAMVVSHAVGSAPYLIENDKNGIIYECGNVSMLAEKLRMVITDSQYRERLAKGAHESIHKEWTAEIAAERLLKLYDKIATGENAEDLFENGVCSIAEPLKNNWIKDKKRR